MAQFQIQGYNYPSYWNTYYGEPASRTSIGALAGTGAGWISLVPHWYTHTLRGSVVRRTDATEDDANVVAAIRQARLAGLNVILKPHVDPDSGEFRGLFNPRNVESWFKTYRSMIVHYARIAEQEGVAAMSIGCELDSLDGGPYAAQWSRIIGEVRAVFSGELTYASLDDGLDESPFWGDLDYIGVDAYVELTNGTMPTLTRSIEAWMVPATWWELEKHGEQGAMAHYQALSEQFGKPILVTETGWRSRDGAAADPGDWATESPRDDAEQVLGYEAFFRAWSGNTGGGDPWVRGVMFWNWDPFDPATNPYASPIDYTPQGKPAEAVVSDWMGSGDRGRWAFRGTDGIDRLTGGSRDEVLVGYRGNDTLIGSGGRDTLYGEGGNDTVTGGGGADTFVIDTPGGGVDVIRDFRSGTDRLALSGLQYGVTGPAVLHSRHLTYRATAPRAATRLIYQRSSGRLRYDADGAGSGAAVVVAVLRGRPALRASDILVLEG